MWLVMNKAVIFKTLAAQEKEHNLRLLALPGAMTILVLAPHPDDFDAIGVTLRFFHEEGHTVYAAVCVTGSGFEEELKTALTVSERENIRIEEQKKSIAFFGLQKERLEFLYVRNEKDEQLAADAENRETVRRFFYETRPDIVFLPHENDSNRAHRAMYQIAESIAAEANWPIALFLHKDPKTLHMRTDFFLAFDEAEASWKRELLRFHDSQQKRNIRTRGYGLDERILQLNRQIAKKLPTHLPYAAAFELRYFSGVESSSDCLARSLC